jgi:exonuclease VII small subunit
MRKPTKKEQALMDELEQVINEKVRIETRLDESLKIYAELEEVADKLSNKLDMVLQSHRLTTQIFSQN